MKKFVVRTLLSVFFPLIILAGTEILLPLNTFTFRAWESLIVKTSEVFYGTFYYEKKLEMTEQGDLAHHTKFAVEKKVKWQTDKLGFRNDVFKKNPEILLIGDSFIAGSALSQENTLSELINIKTGKSVYSTAPYGLNTLFKMFNDGTLEKPDILIMSYVERNIKDFGPLPCTNSKTFMKDLQLNGIFKFFAEQFDKVSKLSSLNYLKARLSGSTGRGKQSPVNENFFFFEGKDAFISPDSAEKCAELILSYQNYFKSIGIDFIFIPLPNKETVYYELVPFEKQPDFLDSLHFYLTKKGVRTINTKELFDFWKNEGAELYHSDDTHWNKNAANILSDEIIEILK